MAPPDDLRWADTDLRTRLLTDPAAVLRDRGVTVPPDTPLGTMLEVARIVLLLWVDGKIVPLTTFAIDPADEGLLFGRGVWESTRTVGGVPWLWNWHVERLQRTAALLGIDVKPDRVPDTRQVTDYVRTLTAQDVVVRLNVTAGRPGGTGLVWMSAALQPVATAPLRLQTVRSPVQKGQPYLTLKTFQYATRLRIGQQALRGGFDTALLVDDTGHLLEAAHANIFVRLADGWATPPADGGLLPGTVRQYLLQHAPFPVRELPIPLARLGEFEEAFLTNSNVGVVPVARIDDRDLPVGNDSLSLVRWLQPPTAGSQLRFVENRFTPR